MNKGKLFSKIKHSWFQKNTIPFTLPKILLALMSHTIYKAWNMEDGDSNRTEKLLFYLLFFFPLENLYITFICVFSHNTVKKKNSYFPNIAL